SQDAAGVEEDVHALLRAQAAEHSDDGLREAAQEDGEPLTLGWIRYGRGRERGVIDDANATTAMPKRARLNLRHDDDAVGRSEQPPIDPVIESVLQVLRRRTVKEAYPVPRRGRMQPAQGVRPRCPLVAVG